MKDFAAIDFETANQQRTSVCSVGIVIVRDGEQDSMLSSSIDKYHFINRSIHSLNKGHFSRIFSKPMSIATQMPTTTLL